MTGVGPLSEAERRALKQLARREVGRVSERIRMVLLASRGYASSQIAAIFECDEATVRTWLARYAAEGVSGLRDRPRAGRPRQADATAREVIRQQVQTPPSALGYAIGSWTILTLTAHRVGACGLPLSRATVRRTVHTLGYVWRRPRPVLLQDPARAAKRWARCPQVLRRAPDAVRRCLDECEVPRLPVRRVMWQPRAQQTHVPTPGSHRKRAIFGALDWLSGDWHYLVREHRCAADFLVFLEQWLQHSPSQPLWLVLDHASIHHAKAVTAWLGEHPRVQLLYRPASSGHRENPVEQVWWRLKDQIAANRLHGSLDALMEAVPGFFSTFTPDDARRLTA
jgi:transposase